MRSSALWMSRSRNRSRNRERIREKCRAAATPGELLLQGSFEEGVVRTAAESFLLNPADDIGRTIFDRDITRLCRTEKHHGVAVHERDVREINRNRFRGGFAGQEPLDFWNIFLSQLSTQPQLEVVTIFPIWSDLQHDCDRRPPWSLVLRLIDATLESRRSTFNWWLTVHRPGMQDDGQCCDC